MNISGNYNTTSREVKIVAKIFDMQKIPYKSVSKYENANDGDVLVILPDEREILIEVKEESYKRLIRYGDLGIDYISAFYFKNTQAKSKWSGRHKGLSDLNAFLATIDRTRPYKRGKIGYSKSDLWLFFVVDDNDRLCYHAFFDGNAMISKEFYDYLAKNCPFAINNKSEEQLSHSDEHSSACFFINHKDKFLNEYKVDLIEYIEKA